MRAREREKERKHDTLSGKKVIKFCSGDGSGGGGKREGENES